MSSVTEDEDEEYLELSYISSGRTKWYSHFGKDNFQLTISYKVKHILTKQPSNLMTSYFPKEM